MTIFIYQVERELLRRSVQKFAPQLAGRILDVGSGAKPRYRKFFDRATEYKTLDINPEFHPDIVGSATAVPQPTGSFDGIVCTQVIGDLLYPEAAIKEFGRLLKSGGRVLVTEGFMDELHSEPQDYWRFTPYGLKGLFEANGFSVEAAETVGGRWSVVLQLKTRALIDRWHLYDRPYIGRFFSKVFRVFGLLTIWLDGRKTSLIQKAAVDVIVVAKKL